MKEYIIEDVAYLQELEKIQKGITFFGSARLAQDNEYCILASKLALEVSRSWL